MAELRYKVIKPLLDNPELDINELISQINENEELKHEMEEQYFSFTKSSLYRWIKKLRQNNYDKLSLVSDYYSSSRRGKSRLSPDIVEIINKVIITAISKENHVRSEKIHLIVMLEIKKRNEMQPQHHLEIPSLRTIQRRIKEIRVGLEAIQCN